MAIKIKLTMLDGRVFKVRNLTATSLHDFINFDLAPKGVELKFYEVLMGVYIRVPNISRIEILDEDFGEDFKEDDKKEEPSEPEVPEESVPEEKLEEVEK